MNRKTDRIQENWNFINQNSGLDTMTDMPDDWFGMTEFPM